LEEGAIAYNVRREKGEGRREKGEGRREKGEGRREKGGRKEGGEGGWWEW